VPQRYAMETMNPSAFNAMRFVLGALTLLPVMWFARSVSIDRVFNMETIKLGVVVGALLFAGALCQQISIQYTSLANAAFITGLYVIIVPVIGFFIGYRYTIIIWVGGALAVLGLYLMTGQSTELSLKGDLMALLGAVFWAIHLLVLANKASRHNQLSLAFHQFMFCALFSTLFSLLYEPFFLPSEFEGYLWPLLNGVVVVGIGYTLQVVVMEHAEPFVASLILSIEVIIGALAGYLFFSEVLGFTALQGAKPAIFSVLLHSWN